MQLLVPRPRAPTVWACTCSLGGGFVAGDQTSLHIELQAGTRCLLGSQSSTKIYRNPSGKPCGHVTEAHIGPDAFLAFLPDPIQPFAGATYLQHQEFHLGQGAGLLLLDWISAGRSACGERWAFSRWQSRNQIFFAGRKVMTDALLLDPADGALVGDYRLGRFNCVALLVAVGPPAEAVASRILEETGRRAVATCASLVQAASPMAHGALLRLAGQSVEQVGQELRRHLAEFDDNPWVQKW